MSARLVDEVETERVSLSDRCLLSWGKELIEEELLQKDVSKEKELRDVKVLVEEVLVICCWFSREDEEDELSSEELSREGLMVGSLRWNSRKMHLDVCCSCVSWNM